MAKYKIVSGSWLDRKSMTVKAVGDEVDFTSKQAATFGAANLRRLPTEAELKAIADQKATEEAEAKARAEAEAKKAADKKEK